MNTVIVQTQRDDGTWKEWKNVAIPVKYGKLLDEQLDYAQVELLQIKKARFEPMTKASITITSKTEDGETQGGIFGDGVIEYLIADDESEETPVGSGIYNHTLTLIEYTKFLECFPLESLCFTNPRGNVYSSNQVAPTISTTIT